MKKTPSERKGIASVTGFGRQKTSYLEMYHLHLFYHLFKKVAAKLQCVAFLGQMHNLGLVKSLWKESMHFFATCLNCLERWHHLSKMEDRQVFPRKGLNCKFQGNTSLFDVIKNVTPLRLLWATFCFQMNYLSVSNGLSLLELFTFLIGMKKPASE